MINEEIKKMVELLVMKKSTREDVSGMASNLIDYIEQNGLDTSLEVFSFLEYIQGFDMSDFDRDYLFTLDDLMLEFNKIRNKF